jgi:3-oxoacyl-[acyl-carrier-protein] synthase II
VTGRRVAVTGYGVKTPAGLDPAALWDSLVAGRSTAKPIARFDASELPVAFACEVGEGFDPVAYLGIKEARRADRVAQFGFAAAVDALAMAGPLHADPQRCGVVGGTGVGGLTTQEAEEQVLMAKGPGRVTPFLVPMMMANATPALIALHHGWTGPNLCVATACAAGSHAIGEASRLIRYGECDVVLAGGAEAAITPIALAAFAKMGALSGRTDDPAAASRPFDADRDGFVMGEGAAFLVLEDWDHAVERGATIVGEILGYARNSDAFHITAPSEDGAGAVACMELALRDAGLRPDQIGHINAHGTSTPLNDGAESRALNKVFGGTPPPVTGTKGVTGHLVGAAGAVEAVATLLALQHKAIPPTANHQRTDPDIALDVVHGEPRPVEPKPVLSNSFGFGGHNATLILGAGATS